MYEYIGGLLGGRGGGLKGCRNFPAKYPQDDGSVRTSAKIAVSMSIEQKI
jgi:hypothetical protein